MRSNLFGAGLCLEVLHVFDCILLVVPRAMHIRSMREVLNAVLGYVPLTVGVHALRVDRAHASKAGLAAIETTFTLGGLLSVARLLRGASVAWLPLSTAKLAQ